MFLPRILVAQATRLREAPARRVGNFVAHLHFLHSLDVWHKRTVKKRSVFFVRLMEGVCVVFKNLNCAN
jgi:hypothetical protein